MDISREEVLELLDDFHGLIKPFKIMYYIGRWLNDDIDDRECVEKIACEGAKSCGAAAGGVGGAAIGSFFGPVGALMGGVVGTVGGVYAARKVLRKLKKRVFCGSKQESLERAYSYLGARPDASNGEIKRKFREKREELLSDGDVGELLVLACFMAIIKCARS